MFINTSNGMKYNDCIRPCIQILGSEDEFILVHYFAQSNSVAYVDMTKDDIRQLINELRKEITEEEEEDEDNLFFVDWKEGNAEVTVDDGTSVVRITFTISARAIDKFINYLQDKIDEN